MGRRGGGEAASLRAFVREKWPGRASALPQQRAARSRDRNRGITVSGDNQPRRELGLPAFLAPAPGRRRDTFLLLFLFVAVVEGEESSFSGSRPRGGGQRWPWGSALVALLWEGLGAARAGGWSRQRGGPARPGMLQPCPGEPAGGGAEPPAAGMLPRAGPRHSPAFPELPPHHAPPRGNNPIPGTLTAQQLSALNPPARSPIAGHDGAVPTPKSPQPHTKPLAQPLALPHTPHTS